MATKLGHLVLEGASFEQVVWFAARSLVMHDYSPDEQVNLESGREDERYLASLRNGIDRDLTDLAQLEATSDEEHEQVTRARALQDRKTTAEIWNADNAKLDEMLAKVADWKLPDGVPERLRERIYTWLTASKHADVQGWYDKEVELIRQNTPSRQEEIEWFKKYIGEKERRIESHLAYMAERNAWLQALDVAVPQPESYAVVQP